jgi:competence protein ComEC
VREAGASALVAASLFAGGVALQAAAARPAGVAPAVLTVALAVALGRGAGRLLAACAAGLLVGALSLTGGSSLDPSRSVEALGTVCSPWMPGLWGPSARLCVERLRQGSEVILGGGPLGLLLAPNVSPPVPGSRIRVRGSLRRAAGYADEVEIPPGPWRLRVKSDRLLARLDAPGPLGRLSDALRRKIRSVFGARGRRRHPGTRLARALALGEGGALPEDWRRALRRCGLSHLVAVSGLHVSLVAGLAALLTAFLPRGGRFAATAAAVVVYLLAVGPGPGILRASSMTLVALAGLIVGRAPLARRGFALTVVALVLRSPGIVLEPGFELSFAAAGGLLGWAPRWTEKLSGRLPRPLAAALAATLAAQTATLPVAVKTFGRFPFAAPLFNLVAVPWAAAALSGSLLWLLAALIGPAALADRTLPLLDLAASPLRALSALPPSAPVCWPWPGGVPAGLVAAAWLAALVEGGGWRRAAWAGALVVVVTGHGGPPPEGGFEAVFADVGQGDSALLVHRGAAVVVDGGGRRGFDVGGRVLRPLLARRGVFAVSAVVVSHSDTDHCLGLLDLASSVPVLEVWAPEAIAGTPCVRKLAGRTARGLTRRLLRGDRFRHGGFSFHVLHPGRGRPGADDNSESLVLAVEAGGRRLLFTGDLDAAAEAFLVARDRAGLAADVLKVAHHGSATSSSSPFLAAVGPRLAVVSAGVGNPYGHPSALVLARLRHAGSRILRTDRDGEVDLVWGRGRPWRIALPGSPRSVPPGAR